MKKSIVIIIVVAIVILVSLSSVKKLSVTPERDKVDTVLLGPKEYKETFDNSMKGGREFYGLYDKACTSINTKNYESAIISLNESLQYVGIGLEKGMVYRKLAEAYREQGNLEKELFYVEQWPKYSMNQQLNEQAKLRASEIRRLLTANVNRKPSEG